VHDPNATLTARNAVVEEGGHLGDRLVAIQAVQVELGLDYPVATAQAPEHRGSEAVAQKHQFLARLEPVLIGERRQGLGPRVERVAQPLQWHRFRRRRAAQPPWSRDERLYVGYGLSEFVRRVIR